jgi:hypothetical protein
MYTKQSRRCGLSLEMTLGHVRAWPVPFKDGSAVASMDLLTEYEVILLTSEGRKVRCKSGAMGANTG